MICQPPLISITSHSVCCRFMAFDRHMNLVLGDAEEFRKLAPKKGRSDEEVLAGSLIPTYPSR